MPKIKINDIEMYYEIQGEGEPLILIAGFSADHTTWDKVIEKFSKHYQVIVFDNRGAGRTDVPQGPYSVEQLAEDVVDLCKALHIKKANFVGSSMGGYILQTLAYKYPELVKCAIISNSTFITHTCFLFYVAAQLDLIKANTPVQALIKASCCWVFSFRFLSQAGAIDNLIQLALDNPYPFTIPGYEAQYAALEAFDSRNWVTQIKVPTLVIAGDQDLIFSESSIRMLANKIPHANYYCFQECGHLPHREYPEEFVQVVTEFTKKASQVYRAS